MKMSRSKIRIWCVALLMLVAAAFTPVSAPAQGWKQVIIKCSPQDLDKIRTLLGAAIVDSMNGGYYLLNVPSSVSLDAIQAIHGQSAIHASDNGTVALQTPQASSSTNIPALGGLTSWYNSPAVQGYVSQPLVTKISLPQALNQGKTGAGVRVAVIDTGVDEHNPTLQSVVLGGMNYVGPTAVPDELNDNAVIAQSTAVVLDQSTAVVLDQSTAVVLDQSTAVVLDQSTAVVLDQSTAVVLDGAMKLPEFGHGTMMAGLIHLVAPYASIVPLKAFDATGNATEWNIIRALHDAVDIWHADVINMSFSFTVRSQNLDDAIQYAASHGAVLVAAAGNANSGVPTYPAAFEHVIGVSSLDFNNQKAAFSNYGPYVGISAPGCYISTYPGPHWAWGCGTSGSTAIVSGVAALVAQHPGPQAPIEHQIEGTADPLSVLPPYQNRLGSGLVDAYNALTAKYVD